MKTSSNHYAECGDDGGKSKSPHETSVHAQIGTGVTCLQETSVPDPLTKSTPSL